MQDKGFDLQGLRLASETKCGSITLNCLANLPQNPIWENLAELSLPLVKSLDRCEILLGR